MKELTLEEKAQRYDEAIKRANELNYVSDRDSLQRKTLEYVFPELKESEDERIRESLLEYLHTLPNHYAHNGVCAPEWIAWLEKQGEQKQYDIDILEKHITKDSISELAHTVIVRNGWEIVDAKEQKPADKDDHLIPQKGMYYTCIKDYYSSNNTHLCVKGNVYKSSFNGYIDDESHLGLSWTNSCAEKYFEPTKDEDWIVCEHDNVIGKPMQYKEFKKKVNQRFIENLKAQGLTPKLRLWNLRDAKDGDVLVCNINKAEIGGDIENLPNITPTICIYQNVVKDQDYIHSYCSLYDGSSLVLQNIVYYNTFVYNIHPATKEQCDTLMKAMADAGNTFDFEKKELRNIEQKSAEWSEEDEWKFSDIMALLRGGENCHYNTPELFDWLKSIKQRIGWKPSEEQMKALHDLNLTGGISYAGQGQVLIELYNDLKKLTE